MDLESTYNAIVYFLNYTACNTDAEIIYHASDMILQTDGDAAYLVSPKAQSCTSGYHCFGDWARTQLNDSVLVLAKSIKHTMAFVAEAEGDALYLNAQEALAIWQYLLELGHP